MSSLNSAWYQIFNTNAAELASDAEKLRLFSVYFNLHYGGMALGKYTVLIASLKVVIMSRNQYSQTFLSCTWLKGIISHTSVVFLRRNLCIVCLITSIITENFQDKTWKASLPHVKYNHFLWSPHWQSVVLMCQGFWSSRAFNVPGMLLGVHLWMAAEGLNGLVGYFSPITLRS